ncbi:dicarboxylate/amino acid:cation symporter [Aerococcus sanguinicola]|uniref:dicarboxylate/amino acid:cation symporter n=1 Tax=unclassified Aerococcus TaxID=2618060 RepID=UPI0008A1CEC9|nr:MULTISPECIES: dicarboxylate/amino acid:cation symporter [unclassified Aerococcus]KAB0647728.1 dicarboxylate/amino acid:cation symporter [Aerococcus sanguinicola]MDK6233032.1 dicarboxylate/amino acid:cation symporter [Aerococcus sp. UMB10185]MDK6804525.1 dicarboxylate/amino acid:cation symporter [Aerococcus sp. UMB7834]MDK6855326.1 dicarboxylate/amino acid:cation symporter [Aerococcus sp. UMB7533]MDK8502182.1 dicarboxylate/amino acid:cation symporter [Aerococcus sp. UMB1112A]
MTSEQKKKKLGLVPRLIIAIILGIIAGQLSFIPEWFLRAFITFSAIFSSFLNFVIPFMIIGLVIKGIADLSDGAGRLLGITALTSYISTLIAGSIAYTTAITLFPHFITDDLVQKLNEAGEGLTPIFEIPLEPFFDVTGAIIFAFMMGLGISWLRQKGQGEALYEVFSDFGEVITQVLATVVIPLLPIYIFGNFANLSYTGSVFTILGVFWKVFIVVIILHLLYISAMFVVAGLYAGKNPIQLIKNQIPGYITAVGTQSSAATIPVNIECAEKNGVSEDIRNFVVPLCATIHLAGSMITITCCSMTLLLMYDMPHPFSMMLGFIMMLGIAMVAAPGAPGGAIMSALPFLPMVGIVSDSMQQLMISLYITQDSFGTAANVSGDNAIAVFIDKLHQDKK